MFQCSLINSRHTVVNLIRRLPNQVRRGILAYSLDRLCHPRSMAVGFREPEEHSKGSGTFLRRLYNRPRTIPRTVGERATQIYGPVEPASWKTFTNKSSCFLFSKFFSALSNALLPLLSPSLLKLHTPYFQGVVRVPTCHQWAVKSRSQHY